MCDPGFGSLSLLAPLLQGCSWMRCAVMQPAGVALHNRLGVSSLPVSMKGHSTTAAGSLLDDESFLFVSMKRSTHPGHTLHGL